MPDLYPYQETGRDFLAAHKVAFLADQPGLGKTPQAIMAARSLYPYAHPKICVVVPKPAIENWKREFAVWWPELCLNRCVMIVNYDLLAMGDSDEFKRFNATRFALFICDEGHRLKTPGSLRSQNIYRKIMHTRKNNPQTRCWILSGTPAKNHAGEMWTHLVALRPDLIMDRSGTPMSQEQFEARFCDVYYDKMGYRRIRGSKNISELREILTNSGFFLRRLKKDVLPDLPPLIFDEYPLPFDHTPLTSLTPYVGTSDNWLRTKLEGMTIDEAIEHLEHNSKTLANWRHDVAELKIPMVKNWAENELEVPGEKLIIFYHHSILGEGLHKLLGAYQPVIVNGKTKDAQAQVDTFQNDPNCRVFIGQITACGEALNITKATQIAFAEASWSPSDNYQAACRAHRIGLKNSLVVRFLSLAGTPDEIVQRVLERKTRELHELFD